VTPRSAALVLVVLAAVGATAAVVDVRADGDTASATPEASALVSPNGTDEYVWPYTSRTRSVTGRTLALNVVVLGDSERVRRVLAARSEADWHPTAPGATALLPWRPAHGAVRYSYVASGRNATGRWVPAAYQLQVGTYFGSRTHLRAYASPGGNWTALQTHTEYWDWFRVRHTVTGVAAGGRVVTDDLRGDPTVASVTRAHHGHRGGGSVGWWTVVGLGPALVAAAGLRRGTERWTRADAALPGGLLAVVLGVRAWGLGAETAVPALSPKLVVVVGYPVLALGPPALAARLGSDRPAGRAAALAAAGFGTGLVLDAALVGVRHVPSGVASHRLALVAAVAAVAYGSARGDRRAATVGAVAWLCALAAALAGLP